MSPRLGVLTRTSLAVIAYVVRVAAFGFTPREPLYALLVDGAIFWLTIWALKHGRDQFGPHFGRRYHWTGLFLIPFWLVLLLTIRDLVLFTHGLQP